MPRAGLDTGAVVDAAARIADAEGLQAATIARVAVELGVRPPSLYAHVVSLDDLRRRIAVKGSRELAAALRSAAVGRARTDALEEIACAYREYAAQHPGSYQALQQPPDPEQTEAVAAATDLVGVVVAVLRGYGLEGDNAVHATRVVRSALHGFVTLEHADGFGLPLDLDHSFAALVQMLDNGLRAGLT